MFTLAILHHLVWHFGARRNGSGRSQTRVLQLLDCAIPLDVLFPQNTLSARCALPGWLGLLFSRWSDDRVGVADQFDRCQGNSIFAAGARVRKFVGGLAITLLVQPCSWLSSWRDMRPMDCRELHRFPTTRLWSFAQGWLESCCRYAVGYASLAKLPGLAARLGGSGSGDFDLDEWSGVVRWRSRCDWMIPDCALCGNWYKPRSRRASRWLVCGCCLASAVATC